MTAGATGFLKGCAWAVIYILPVVPCRSFRGRKGGSGEASSVGLDRPSQSQPLQEKACPAGMTVQLGGSAGLAEASRARLCLRLLRC